MFAKLLTSVGLVVVLAAAPAEPVRADAGDFIGGAIVGGLIGHAMTRQNQQRTYTTTTRRRSVARSSIPVTERGVQTQAALNYFGFNAGRVDGQIGAGTRRAIEAYQASMGYPVNGHDFQPYQFDALMQAQAWAQSGGQMQTRLSGQPLLAAWRQQMQGAPAYGAPSYAGGAVAPVAPPGTMAFAATPAPAPEAPAPVVSAAAEPEAEAPAATLPNLFAGGAPALSLANRCNAVMLQTSTNGGYATLASMSDPEQTLSEQFCLARTYAIAQGEELMQSLQGLTAEQVATQCTSFGEMLGPRTDAISLSSPADVEAEMREFARSTGIAPADLAATARVCLAVGYGRDNMRMALGSALMLATLGEPAYGELLGHHLREGFGTTERPDLAMAWYATSLDALEGGAKAVFVPSQTGSGGVVAGGGDAGAGGGAGGGGPAQGGVAADPEAAELTARRRLRGLGMGPRDGNQVCRQPTAISGFSCQDWCGREDSNFHGSYPTATSTLRVYQFRHDRTDPDVGALIHGVPRVGKGLFRGRERRIRAVRKA